MLTLIRLLLSQLRRSLAIGWISLLFFALGMIAIVLGEVARERSPYKRIVTTTQRVGFYIFVHSVMQLSAPNSSQVILKMIHGLATLAALSILPNDQLPPAEANKFHSQITFAYALQTEEVLTYFASFPTFKFLVIFAMLGVPVVQQRMSGKIPVVDVFLEAMNLVAFDASTSVLFVDSGENLVDLSTVLFVYIILWHAQQNFPLLQSVQQYTVWRVAGFVKDEFEDLKCSEWQILSGGLLLLMMPVSVHLNWLSPLSFLLVLSVLIQILTEILNTMGALDSLPILLSILLSTAFLSQHLDQAKVT